MIITISGVEGAGKSTIAKLLAKKLNYNHYSMGDLQRKYAKQHNMTIEEFGELEAKDPSIDKEVDEYQTKLGNEENNFIIDGRISFKFIPNSFKLFLDCDEEIATKRIFEDTKTGKRDESEKKTNSFEETKEIRSKRMRINQERFIKYYEIDYLNKNNYDLVIKTSKISPELIVEKIIKEIKKNK